MNIRKFVESKLLYEDEEENVVRKITGDYGSSERLGLDRTNHRDITVLLDKCELVDRTEHASFPAIYIPYSIKDFGVVDTDFELTLWGGSSWNCELRHGMFGNNLGHVDLPARADDLSKDEFMNGILNNMLYTNRNLQDSLKDSLTKYINKDWDDVSIKFVGNFDMDLYSKLAEKMYNYFNRR